MTCFNHAGFYYIDRVHIIHFFLNSATKALLNCTVGLKRLICNICTVLSHPVDHGIEAHGRRGGSRQAPRAVQVHKSSTLRPRAPSTKVRQCSDALPAAAIVTLATDLCFCPAHPVPYCNAQGLRESASFHGYKNCTPSSCTKY